MLLSSVISRVGSTLAGLPDSASAAMLQRANAASRGRWLSPDQHRDYQAWIDNDRRLHELLTRLEALGTTAFEADPRWER